MKRNNGKWRHRKANGGNISVSEKRSGNNGGNGMKRMAKAIMHVAISWRGVINSWQRQRQRGNNGWRKISVAAWQ